jgi:hypothetical protein
MIGMLHPAGEKWKKVRTDYVQIAEYFEIEPAKLKRLLTYLENAERPELLLLQARNAEATIHAAVIMSSVWSRSYRKLRKPDDYQIHRDYYYQCLFSGMLFLTEAGCDAFQIENPKTGYKWQWDGFICVCEAWFNIRRHVNPVIRVAFKGGSYEESLWQRVEELAKTHAFEEHRPIGTSPHVEDGLNMRTIFVDTRDELRQRLKMTT